MAGYPPLLEKIAKLTQDSYQRKVNPSTEILITAGASAPEDVVEECVEWLRLNYNAQVENRIIREEHVQFPLPRELRVISNSVS